MNSAQLCVAVTAAIAHTCLNTAGISSTFAFYLSSWATLNVNLITLGKNNWILINFYWYIGGLFSMFPPLGGFGCSGALRQSPFPRSFLRGGLAPLVGSPNPARAFAAGLSSPKGRQRGLRVSRGWCPGLQAAQKKCTSSKKKVAQIVERIDIFLIFVAESKALKKVKESLTP